LWQYSFEHWGRVRADRYIARIEARFRDIANNPRLGRPAAGTREGQFKLLVEAHVILYRVDGEQISIVRVLHQRMDPSRNP
jgi:toxin ParE1/3/4